MSCPGLRRAQSRHRHSLNESCILHQGRRVGERVPSRSLKPHLRPPPAPRTPHLPATPHPHPRCSSEIAARPFGSGPPTQLSPRGAQVAGREGSNTRPLPEQPRPAAQGSGAPARPRAPAQQQERRGTYCASAGRLLRPLSPRRWRQGRGGGVVSGWPRTPAPAPVRAASPRRAQLSGALTLRPVQAPRAESAVTRAARTTPPAHPERAGRRPGVRAPWRAQSRSTERRARRRAGGAGRTVGPAGPPCAHREVLSPRRRTGGFPVAPTFPNALAPGGPKRREGKGAGPRAAFPSRGLALAEQVRSHPSPPGCVGHPSKRQGGAYRNLREYLQLVGEEWQTGWALGTPRLTSSEGSPPWWGKGRLASLSCQRTRLRGERTRSQSKGCPTACLPFPNWPQHKSSFHWSRSWRAPGAAIRDRPWILQTLIGGSPSPTPSAAGSSGELATGV